MPSIPIDILREILEHVHEADLPTLCRVNKIFCSYSQDVLYREIKDGDLHVIQTLSQSTDLARRVRSFSNACSSPELATALQNMSSLRWLSLWGIENDSTILDGCTFKLDKFFCDLPNSKPLQQFINSQPSLTHVVFLGNYEPFDERCLPNLTRVMGNPSLLRNLIPGRPVRDVTIIQLSGQESVDFRIFTLSAAPIEQLLAHYNVLYPTPGSFLVSIFPSLVRLDVYAHYTDWEVRIPLLYLAILRRALNK
jgi:F-box domain